jgi:hypothetical protein
MKPWHERWYTKDGGPEVRRKAEKALRHARGEYPEDFHGQWAGDDEL